MTFKAIVLSCGVAALAMSASAALAGGPTTPNAQTTPSIAAVNAVLSAAGAQGVTATAVVNNGNGTLTVTTSSGQRFTMSSTFVANVLSVYG